MLKRLNRKSRCSGVTQRLHTYGIIERNLFDQIIEQVRAEFIEDAKDPQNFQGEVLVGKRAMNDTDVEMTLRSWASPEAFKKEPLTWIYDALQDCAERDFWYANEKVWLDSLRQDRDEE